MDYVYASAHPHILCVDDNKDAADSAVMLLQASGYDAEAFYDGPAALRRAEEAPPDVCFIDLNMPGMGGDELARALRGMPFAHPPLLVAVTAMDSAAAVRRVAAAGFAVHLVKPADPEELVRLAGSLPGRRPVE